MKTFWTWTLLLAASVALLLSAGTALAVKGIKDTDNFFSPQAEQKANAIINDIFTKHRGEEVYIETFESIPDGMTYQQFVDEHIRATPTRGVYVLIVRKGAHV